MDRCEASGDITNLIVVAPNLTPKLFDALIGGMLLAPTLGPGTAVAIAAPIAIEGPQSELPQAADDCVLRASGGPAYKGDHIVLVSDGQTSGLMAGAIALAGWAPRLILATRRTAIAAKCTG